MTDVELIRAAAEKVMGWPEWKQGDSRPEVIPYFDIPHGKASAILHWANGSSEEWNPLAFDADTFQLVDKLAGESGEFTMERSYMIEFHGPGWWVSFDDDKLPGRAPDRRRAIVLAALRACGVETGGAE